ncbi:MAG: hypothetical protein RL120_17120, partial [Gammaproteobacteria bacterium]
MPFADWIIIYSLFNSDDTLLFRASSVRNLGEKTAPKWLPFCSAVFKLWQNRFMDDLSSPLWLTSINFVGAINALIIAATMLVIPATRRSAAAQHLIALLALFGIVSLMV